MSPLADAIVVLGCRLLADGRPSGALERRLWLAERAYREGAADWIVVSGGRSWHGRVEALAMWGWLSDRGIPDDRLVAEPRSLSTMGNARFSARVLSARGAQRALLATCSWHLPRAARAFARFGIEPVAPPAQWVGELGEPAPSTWTRARELACRWLDARAISTRRAAVERPSP